MGAGAGGFGAGSSAASGVTGPFLGYPSQQALYNFGPAMSSSAGPSSGVSSPLARSSYQSLNDELADATTVNHSLHFGPGHQL
jgi:hypothetical protein